MPIPRSRSELVGSIRSTFGALRDELEEAGPDVGGLMCVEDWTVKDLLAVRTWWTERVVDWIEAGRRGEAIDLPAHGYSWRETPRLNDDIVRASRAEPYASIVGRLVEGHARVLTTIDGLEDRELLEAGAFPWTGKWPIARWISINTVRQYETARTLIRRARRDAG